ncbi:MAG: hypothetical protein Q8908_10280, partial [Bacteroidota bacterium]|nr:hypothetical protein [Bacteroidota bacterium]
MQRLLLIIILETFFLSCNAHAQKSVCRFVPFNSEPRYEKGVRIVFYNVENLFDFTKDTLAKDEEFLPEGLYDWTPGKFFHKLQSIGKVLLSTGGWEPPEIIGL